MNRPNGIIEEMKRRRQRFARILLAVFLPMMMLSAVHVHEEVASLDCEQCAQHVSHAGHVSAANSHTVGTLFISVFHLIVRQWQVCHAPCGVVISHSQRGPPALF